MASIALPTIGRDLNIVEYKLQWIVSAYALSSVRPSLVSMTLMTDDLTLI